MTPAKQLEADKIVRAAWALVLLWGLEGGPGEIPACTYRLLFYLEDIVEEHYVLLVEIIAITGYNTPAHFQ